MVGRATSKEVAAEDLGRQVLQSVREMKAENTARVAHVEENRRASQLKQPASSLTCDFGDTAPTVISLAIAVDSWIIQDGNYDDFAVGDRTSFALEFAGNQLRPSASRVPRAMHVGHGVYDLCAQVCFLHSGVWIVDFGTLAFWEAPPPSFAEVGGWVEGRALLGIDPFFYKEYLYKLPGMPCLFYDWRISGIERNDTPWLFEANAQGGGTYTRDEAQMRWSSVARTDAWNDDNGRSAYVLSIERDT